MIRKGKKYSKNSMKINSKFVRFVSTPTIGWSQIFQTLDSFEIRSIRKFMIRLIQKVKNNSKNSIKINSKFVRLTPPLLQAVLSMLLLSTVWKFKDFLSSVRFYVKSILDNLEVLNLPFFATLGVLKFFFWGKPDFSRDYQTKSFVYVLLSLFAEII